MSFPMPLPSDPDLIHAWTFSRLSAALDSGDAARSSLAASTWPEERRQRREQIGRVLVPDWEVPDPCVTITGSISRSDKRTGARWKILKLRFQSLQDYWVTALLYVPETGRGPFPGMIVASGHLLEAKAGAEYHGISEELARQGMVVLAFDPVAQGERVQAWDYVDNKFLVGWGTTEHDFDGQRALLCGWPFAQAFVWDGQRALDVLLSRPEVDPSRVGVCGISGGGTQTTWLLAADDRFTAASPACFITGWREQFAARVGADPEQFPFPANGWGWDQADVLLSFAPKPLLIVAATRDFFPIEGTRSTYQKLKDAYSLIGAAGNVAMFEGDFDHAYHPPLREATVRWFCSVFGISYDGMGAVEAPCNPDDLRVTPTGQLLTSGFPRTLRHWIAQNGSDRSRSRVRGSALYHPEVWQARRRGLLSELLGVPSEAPQASATPLETSSWDGLPVRRWLLTSEPGVEIPCALVLPPNEPRGLLCFLHEKGAATGWQLAGGPLSEAVEEGWAVLSVDPRGVGAGVCRTQGNFYPDYHGRFGVESHITWTWTMLGRPFFGQRVFDVLQALRCARNMPDLAGRKNALVGVGSGALWALFASALDGMVDKTLAHAPLIAFGSLLDAHEHSWHVSSLPPGMLTWGDVQHVAALISPRELTLLHPVDAARLPVSRLALSRAYRDARSVFNAQGASSRLTLVPSEHCGRCERPRYVDWLRD